MAPLSMDPQALIQSVRSILPEIVVVATALFASISVDSGNFAYERCTPGTFRTRLSSLISGLWSVPSNLQTVGWTHESRLHFASTSGRVQRIRYMFAVAPPTSLTTPLNSGSAASFSTS